MPGGPSPTAPGAPVFRLRPLLRACRNSPQIPERGLPFWKNRNTPRDGLPATQDAGTAVCLAADCLPAALNGIPVFQDRIIVRRISHLIHTSSLASTKLSKSSFGPSVFWGLGMQSTRIFIAWVSFWESCRYIWASGLCFVPYWFSPFL